MVHRTVIKEKLILGKNRQENLVNTLFIIIKLESRVVSPNTTG